MKLFYIYLILINIVTFFIYGADKSRARKNKWRIPEKRLLLLAVIGGSIGAEAGMLFFRHKTKHPLFTIGIPAVLIAQILIAWAVLNPSILSSVCGR